MKPNSTLNAQVLAATASLHKLDLPALQQAFAHVPIDIIDDAAPFPEWLRLVISSHCEQQCQYPDEGILWCHNEGIARDGLKAPSVESLLALTRFFLEQYGVQRIIIGGLEPALGPRFYELISQLRQLGIIDIGFTTHGLRVNGKLKDLKEAGLTRLTVSIQHFERENYRRLTGRDGLADALALVEEAKRVGLQPIKINRVLLRYYSDDIPDFVNWLRAENLTARLFDLMWQPGHDSYYLKYLISWQDFLPLWADHTERISVRRYRISWRTRILFKLRGGGGVEVNLLQPKWQSSTPVCQSCHLAEVCAEGYLGCGVRITPDLKLSTCILRNDLSYDMQPVLLLERDKAYTLFINDVLQGSQKVADQSIPLLNADEIRQFIIRAKSTVEA